MHQEATLRTSRFEWCRCETHLECLLLWRDLPIDDGLHIERWPTGTAVPPSEWRHKCAHFIRSLLAAVGRFSTFFDTRSCSGRCLLPGRKKAGHHRIEADSLEELMNTRKNIQMEKWDDMLLRERSHLWKYWWTMMSGVGSRHLYVHAVTARLEDWAWLGSPPRASQTGALWLPPCTRATPGTSWKKSWSSTVVLRCRARNALVHLPGCQRLPRTLQWAAYSHTSRPPAKRVTG